MFGLFKTRKSFDSNEGTQRLVRPETRVQMHSSLLVLPLQQSTAEELL